VTQMGEGVNISIAKDDPEKSIVADVIELEFVDCFKACVGQTVIKPPHWPAAIDALTNQSAKAAVFAFDKKGTQKAKVKIKITSKGYSGNGKLTGLMGALEFEGTVPLSSGEHIVQVTLKDPPTALLWVKTKIMWGIEATDKSVLAGKTPVEVFFVFTDPSKMIFFTKDGVWIEALRFIFSKGKLATIKKEPEAVAGVTTACFSLPNHKYEVKRGAANFGGATTKFKLKEYIDGSDGAVNCYDQTYAVIVFSGAVGISVDGLFMEPFGFIKTVNLVGWGSCNNPFPQKPYKDNLVISPTNTMRKSFGNHMFCEFRIKIYDACAGPVKGNVNRAGYVANTIDSVMPPGNAGNGLPGTISNIVSIANVYGRIDATVKGVE
jgi:hypothetical protein